MDNVPDSLITAVADSTSHRDRDTIDRSVANLVADFLGASSATFYLLNEDEGVQRLVPRVSLTYTYELGAMRAEDVASEVVLLEDASLWKACRSKRTGGEHVEPDGTTCGLWPLESERGVMGLLVVRGMRAVTTRDRDLVAGILRIQKNHLSALDYGELDTLTGMLNRKTFEARFAKLRSRLLTDVTTSSTGDPSWLGLVDIDKFKSINDTYGHLFGDEVLLLVAQHMSKCFRGADQLFRFGGEEFVIVLDRATEAGARIAFDRLRRTVEEFQFPQVGRVTISLGYSQIQAQDATPSCVERADAALYYAKNHGRNNVRNFEELVSAGELTARRESDDTELF